MVEHSNSQVPEPRALTERERALILWMLERAATRSAELIEHLALAHVVSGCDCGCATIELEVEGHPRRAGGISRWDWRSRPNASTLVERGPADCCI